jgi:type II secretory ATPase GspE/PulE/Tfp pilus assembly ATPase PilB-like protein
LLLSDVLKGYNGTIFAYGQTGSGKSFSMFGPDINDSKARYSQTLVCRVEVLLICSDARNYSQGMLAHI